jgi:uncharacterized protein YfiM (DUF2279 family)
MIEPAAKRPVPRRRLTWLWWLLAALVLLLVLFFDVYPLLPRKPPPAAEQVVAGRDAFRQVKAAAAGPPPSTVVTLSNRDLNDIATLAGNAMNIRRVRAEVAGSQVRLAASLEPLPRLWLNITATIAPSASGFPPVAAQIGELPLPRWLTRLGLDATRRLLVWRGSELPPLDDLVRRVSIADDVVAVELKSPLGRSGLVRQATGVITRPVDSQRVLAIFCHLAAAQTEDRQTDLAVQLQRAMAFGAPAGPAEAIAENRAALVAVAMLATGRNMGQLAGSIQEEAEACPGPTGDLRLAGRNDLAKHWALSAALAAMTGGDIGRAMGEFKELADSLDGGSGFSFVDLAADRAGLRVGRAATARASAEASRAMLATADNRRLLPIDIAKLTEGIAEADFRARYGDIDSPQFAEAVRRIDALLDAGGLLK